MAASRSPRRSLSELAELGTANLTRVIAVDSQSDERSNSVPSTIGQRRLSEMLASFFSDLGFEASLDSTANLLVRVPATDGASGAPKLAFMVHMDTSRGTEAVEHLESLAAWDGSRIPFPQNDRLQVTVKNYPQTQVYVGDDILFGPGRYPIGLDDKLGMSEMMTLGQVLAEEPEIPHGDLMFICRPDEEIGRMAAVEGLAEELARRGIRYAYTLDGLAPFEVEVENFHASRAIIKIHGETLAQPAAEARRITLRVDGCKSHGATAKAEGYLNATVIFVRAMDALAGRDDIVPIRFVTDLKAETDADLTFRISGADTAAVDAAEAAVVAAFSDVCTPHAWKGARVTVASRDDLGADAGPVSDEVVRLLGFLRAFLGSNGPMPMLSEDSDDYERYSNPYQVDPGDGHVRLYFRLRDFDRGVLDAREAHIRALVGDSDDRLELEIEQQYVNMGPSLAPYPELVTWAKEAAEAMEAKIHQCPIRGGTGVDPFLARDIPVANLGTGYFAPESEKEFTSRQTIGRHVMWLVHLVQRVAAT